MTFKRKIKLDCGNVITDRRNFTFSFGMLKWLVVVVFGAGIGWAGYISLKAEIPKINQQILDLHKQDVELANNFFELKGKTDFLVDSMQRLSGLKYVKQKYERRGNE